MSFRVLDNEGMNLVSSSHDEYASMVESALTRMELDGYRLVAIEQPSGEDGSALYILHKD